MMFSGYNHTVQYIMYINVISLNSNTNLNATYIVYSAYIFSGGTYSAVYSMVWYGIVGFNVPIDTL